MKHDIQCFSFEENKPIHYLTIRIKVIFNSNVVASKIIKQFADGIANTFLHVLIFHIMILPNNHTNKRFNTINRTKL